MIKRLLKGYGRFVHTFLCLNGGGTKAMNNEDRRDRSLSRGGVRIQVELLRVA